MYIFLTIINTTLIYLKNTVLIYLNNTTILFLERDNININESSSKATSGQGLSNVLSNVRAAATSACSA